MKCEHCHHRISLRCARCNKVLRVFRLDEGSGTLSNPSYWAYYVRQHKCKDTTVEIGSDTFCMDGRYAQYKLPTKTKK